MPLKNVLKQVFYLKDEIYFIWYKVGRWWSEKDGGRLDYLDDVALHADTIVTMRCL